MDSPNRRRKGAQPTKPTVKQFSLDADVTPDQWNDGRRNKAHKDGGVVDIKIRNAIKLRLSH